jgi:hypothetical protein
LTVTTPDRNQDPKTTTPPFPGAFRCPRCGNWLEPSGAVVLDGVESPVYQCDAEGCVVMAPIGGEVFPSAYTFLVGPDGKPQDFEDDPSVN